MDALKAPLRLLLLFAGILLLLSDFSYRVLDEWHYFLLTESLATRASVWLPAAQFELIAAPPPAAGALLPTRFPPGYPLAAVPVYWLLRAVASLAGITDYGFIAGSIEWANALLTALLLVLLARWLAREFAAPRRAALVAAAFGLGTILLQYARSNFSETLQALLLGAAVMLLLSRPVLREPRAGVWFGICLGWLVLTKATFLLFVPLLLLWAYCTPGTGRLRLLPVGLPLLVGLVLYGGYNRVRTGDWFDFYYPSLYTVDVGGRDVTVPQNFSAAPWHGLAGYLISPGKSIFLTSPLLLLALPGAVHWWRRRRRDLLFMTLLLTAYTLLFACFTGWEGGLCWGPRFLVPLIPLLALLGAPVFFAPRRAWRSAAWLLAACSLLLQLFVAGTDNITALSVARPPYGIGRYYPLALNPYPPLLAQYRGMLAPPAPPPAGFFLRMADLYRPAFWWWTR